MQDKNLFNKGDDKTSCNGDSGGPLVCKKDDGKFYQVRDHPYVTSAHFWTFSDPPTHPTSAKIVIFLTPPTQSLCWRNIGMVPKDLNTKYHFVVGCFYDLKFRVEFLLEFRSHLLLTTRKITSSWYRATNYENTNTELSMFFVKKKSAFLLKINSYFGIYLYLLIVKQKSKTNQDP